MTNSQPQLVRDKSALRQRVKLWHAEGLKVGLVPTMGQLHHGHLSLIQAIAPHVDKIVVSIFVNPKQFGEGEDFDAYPRDLKGDLDKLTAGPCDLVYAPSADQIYPAGFKTLVRVTDISIPFEGLNRPGHFDGVATVCCKLILQCAADVAIFGEKDWQQLAIVRRMVRDLDIPCEILGGPLIRESDGLAASSRNIYLSREERAIAGQFNIALKALVADVTTGMDLRTAEAKAKAAVLAAGFDKVDYLSVINAETMEVLNSLSESLAEPARVVSTARIRHVRLLDNMAITKDG